METLPRGPEPSVPEVGMPPKPPSTPAPSIRGLMGKRLVSPSGFVVEKQEAEAAKKIFLSKLREISGAIREIEEAPLWESSETLSDEALEGVISDRERKIGNLEGQLAIAEEKLALSGTVLGRDYKQLSQQIMQIKAKLSVLRSSLELDKMLSNQGVKDAIALAKETQEACQELSRLSRHSTAFSKPGTRAQYEAAVGKLTKCRERLALMSVAGTPSEAGAKVEAAKAMAAKICNEALELLWGTAQRVTTSLNALSLPIVNPGLTLSPLRAIREARETFQSERSETVRLLGAIGGSKSTSTMKVQRLTLSGRQIHAQEVHDLEESLRELEIKTTRLADKVARGTASEADRQTVEQLKTRLGTVVERYQALSLTIGKKMSPEQFLSRAVASISIEGLSSRIEAIEAALSTEIGAISDSSREILENLSVAMKSEGQERALAFYAACATLEKLRDQVEMAALQNPLAGAILEQKVEQLTSQVQSAAQKVLSLGGSQEIAEYKSAIQIGSGVATPDRKQAVPFLINVMTKLTMFAEVPDAEALAFRATVDLCMLQMSEELGDIPEELLQRYREMAGPEYEGTPWATQIDDVHKSIVEFGTQLAQTRGRSTRDEAQGGVLEAIEQLTVCEQKLASSEASLHPEIFTAYKDAFERMKADTPLEFTKKEMALVKSLPKSPTHEDKATIKLALAKLMFQAQHHPDKGVRQAAADQVFDLMNKMGFRNEYQSVFAELQNLKVMGEFRRTVLRSTVHSIDVPQTGTAMQQARARLFAIFSNGMSSAGLQSVLTADMFPERLNATEREQLKKYICIQQDVASLRYMPMLSRKEPSLEYGARLQGAYDRVCEYQNSRRSHEPDFGADLGGFKSGLTRYTERCFISEDKAKIARGVLCAVRGEEGAERKYFVERIMEEEDPDKKIERMNRIISPLLLEAISTGPQKNPELVQDLPKILMKFIEIDPDFLTRSPETLLLLAQYVTKKVGVPVASLMDSPNAFIFALLQDAILNEPPKNPELVGALPRFLILFIKIDPDFLTRYPETLPLLAQYVAKVAATKDYQSFGGRMAVPAEDVQRASEVFQRFITEVPPFQPTQDWRDQADEFLKAARVLSGAIGVSTLFVTTTAFEDVARTSLMSSVRAYEEHEVLKNPKIIEARQALQEIASQLTPEALDRNGYETFPDLFQAYKEKSVSLRKLLEEAFPFDSGLVMITDKFPHAEFLSSYRGGLEREITGHFDEMVSASRSAYFASEVGRTVLENGKRFIEQTLQNLQDLSPEERREILFSDSIRDGFRESIGNPPPALLESIEKDLFHLFMHEERSQIQRLAGELTEGQSFNPELFQEYTERVSRLFLLSNIRYSGKYAQPIGDDTAELSPTWHNPLLQLEKKEGAEIKTQLEALRELPGFTDEHAGRMDHFIGETQSLAANLNDFQLRVKDARKRPPGYLEKEMRKATQGFLDFATGRRRLILEVFEEDKNSPAYERSFTRKLEQGLKPPKPEVMTGVRDRLTQAAEKLHEYEESVIDKLSLKTKEKMKDPQANQGVLFGEDLQLTPEKIQEIACDKRINEVRALLAEAAELAKDDSVLFQQVKGLYSQIGQWFSLVLKDVISSCTDEQIRKALLDQNAKIQ